MKEADVIVVGAGPAGAACAGTLRQAGTDVLLLDRSPFPRPKPCAGWITPRVFDLLGTEPEAYPGLLAAFGKLHLRIGRLPVLRPGRQYAIRRSEFDAWLLKRWQLSPENHEVQQIDDDGSNYVVDGLYSAPLIVGAGGTGCPVYRAFGHMERHRGRASEIIAMEEEFPAEAKSRQCYLWFFRRGLPGYAWYLPKVGAGESWINVGIGGAREKLAARGEKLRDHWYRFVQYLQGRGLVAERAWRPVARNYYLRQGGDQGLSSPGATLQTAASRGTTQAPRLYLIGDAAGLATVDMGEGIAAAIESGQLAAEAIIAEVGYSAEAIPRFSLLPRLLQGLWR